MPVQSRSPSRSCSVPRPRVRSRSVSCPSPMRRRKRISTCWAVRTSVAAEDSPPPEGEEDEKDETREDPDLPTLLRRFWKVAAPYWSSEENVQARLRQVPRTFYKAAFLLPGGFAVGIPAHLYRQIESASITYVSIGHRRTLYHFHNKLLHVSKFDSENGTEMN